MNATLGTVEPIIAEEGEIPLPPPEMFEQLDNSGMGVTQKEAPASTSSPHQVAPTVAVLEFVGEKKPWVEVPLRYPFRWNGVVIETIVVHRLKVQQIIDYIDGLGDDEGFDRQDIYGLMCSLPGAVIRALPDPDGSKVVDVCHDFLPRVFGGVGT